MQVARLQRGSVLALALVLALGAACQPAPQTARTMTLPPLAAEGTSTPGPALTAMPSHTPAAPLPPPVPARPSPEPVICGDGCIDLIDGRWSGQVSLTSNAEGGEQLEWGYRFTDPARTESQLLTYSLRDDLTQYPGFILRLYVENPEYVDLTLFLLESDGDSLVWELDRESTGWVIVVVNDINKEGRGPLPWDPGDHVRQVGEINGIQISVSDILDRTRPTEGSVVISEFKLLSPARSLEVASKWHWYVQNQLWWATDLWTIGRMDDPSHWAGPHSEDIERSEDGIDGSLAVRVDLEPGHHLRLERNILAIAGQPRLLGPDDLPPGLMAVADLSSVTSMRFRYRTEISQPAELAFRLWDRTGGFLEWTVASGGLPDDWTDVSLAVPPPGATPAIDLDAIGGFNWELRALDQPLTGRIWLDELLFDPAIPGEHAPRSVSLPSPASSLTISPPSIAQPAQSRPTHLVMNATFTYLGFEAGDPDVFIREMDRYLRLFSPVPGLEYLLGPTDPSYLDRLGEERLTEIVREVATWLERNRVPFYLGVAGGDGMSTTPRILQAALEAAPTTCLGAYVGEVNEPGLYPGDLESLVKMADLLRDRGKHMLFHRYQDLWWQFTWNRYALDQLFSPENRDVVVPMWENIEPSCLSLTMGSTLGFWASGRTSNWGESVQSWGWTNMFWTDMQSWEPVHDGMPAHEWMRTLVGAAAFGANYIEIEPEWAIRGDVLDALVSFARLVESGAIAAPASPEALISLPRVALQTRPPVDTWGWGPGVLACAQGKNWARSRLLPTDTIAAFLYQSSHYYEDILPETPYGLVAIMPPGPVPEGTRILTTDGWGVLEGGSWLYDQEARDLVQSAFAEAATQMPLLAEDCTFSAIRLGEGDYLAYLIDPEERFPVGVSTFLSVRLDDRWAAFDGISGEELPSTSDGVSIEIPTGGFRLVRVVSEGG